MRIRDDHPSDGKWRTDRRRLLETGGVLAGAAALLGNVHGGRCGRSVSSTLVHEEKHHADLATRPDLLPLAALGDAGARREAGLRRAGQSHRRRPARRHRRRRRRPHLELLRPARRRSRDDARRRRAAPLRLERLLLDALPERAAPARRAALPDRAGPRLLAHLHHRHQARPDAAPDRQDDRAGGGGRAKTGYANGHTVHCGPDGIYVSALGAPDGDGPGGIFMLDHDTFDVLGRWEIDRGEQYLHYDFWWHLGYDTLVSSEWGTPNMVETGVQPELLLDGQYGHRLHFWDLRERRHVADARPGQGASDRPRAAAGARPDQGLRLRQHRRQPERPLRHHLPLAPQGRAPTARRMPGRRTRSSPSRPSRRRRTSCRRPSSRSRPCRRWSPTSS